MARRFTPKLERAPLPFVLVFIPIISVMIGSLLQVLIPLIAQYPILPPFGCLIFIAWRLLVRDIWDAWMGIPLGFFDDLCSGHALGTSAFGWTCLLLIMEFADRRMMWRDYTQDWQLGTLLITVSLIVGLILTNVTGGDTPLWLLFPQFLISILCLPIALRIVARLDRFRWRS